MEDFCDGKRFKSHPVFSNDPYALQIIDELELCNPLGTHVKKHKLAIVLFTLGNIHPKYRSSLRLIHLVIAATVPVVEKHGINEILKPFIEDLNALAAEGISVVHLSEHLKVLFWHGWVIILVAIQLVDLSNLFHLLFGFVERAT